MNSQEGRLTEAKEGLPDAASGDVWVVALDKVIGVLMAAIAVTLCVPLCSLFYR